VEDPSPLQTLPTVEEIAARLAAVDVRMADIREDRVLIPRNSGL
jgi:hypothetical protein